MTKQNDIKENPFKESMINRIKNINKWDIGLFILCMGFYLFFPFYDGPVWCKDSPSYASMGITREPLYPTFLWIFRRIFGEEGYLMPVVIAQSILAAYATWKLAVTVKAYKDDSKLLALLSVGFQFGVTFLCRFVAIRGSSYIDSIMTEGLGLSLYVLFVVQLYKYIMTEKGRNLIGAAGMAMLLVNLRKQMMLSLCLLAAVAVLYYLIKKRKIQKLLLLLLLTAGLFAACKMTDRLYNYCVRGAWIEHSGNAHGVLCTLIYTSKEEDAELFEEDVLKDLYKEILAQADAQGLRVIYAPEGWVELSSHYADSYDAIGYGIINPVIQGYVADNYEYSQVDGVLKFDEYCEAMTGILLGQEKGDLVRVLSANIGKGFVNSIARVNRLLNIYAIGAYALYLVLYVWAVRKKRNWSRPEETLTFAEIVIGGVIGNSLVVGVTIFCQPRYMIYNMGLFYSALSMLLYDFAKYRGWKKEKDGKQCTEPEKKI